MISGKVVAFSMVCLVILSQLGVSAYLSFGMLAFIVVLYGSKLDNDILVVIFLLAVFIAQLILLEVSASYSSYVFSRELRATILLAFIFLVAKDSNKFCLESRVVSQYAVFGLIGLMIFTVFQLLLIKSGKNGYLPVNFFAVEDGQLASAVFEFSELRSLEFQGRVSGPFSEPSFLGYSVILLFCIVISCGDKKNIILAAKLSLCIVLISQSILGIAGVLLLYTTIDRRMIVFFPIFILGFLLLYSLNILPEELNDRIKNLVAGNDSSASGRLMDPLITVNYVLQNRPFGMPLTSVSSVLSNLGLFNGSEDSSGHNGVLNIIIAYGWFGIVLIVALFMRFNKPHLAIFLIVFLMQNGDPFTPSKVAFAIFLLWVTFASDKKDPSNERQKC